MHVIGDGGGKTPNLLKCFMRTIQSTLGVGRFLLTPRISLDVGNPADFFSCRGRFNLQRLHQWSPTPARG
ncbi:hypothetical protein TNCV_2487591 [Trichonephila clavipes]|uniref:Uncharacterized protein n=1 Tax=Trichonephila clavipes TaxID=2585209 RepID=A0A8X7BCH1_TRICX|nr:hypothetical protein TNCV_2487591 [Trichonephila clavipes]